MDLPEKSMMLSTKLDKIVEVMGSDFSAFLGMIRNDQTVQAGFHSMIDNPMIFIGTVELN